jgi:hypothetical protein
MSPLLFAVLITASAAPAPGQQAQTTALLDQKRIHRDYNEGNFENVIADIEGFQKSHATYPASDSVFIAKHLAVVYSANPGTREKGKYYMFRLLEMLPSAKLVDMYVSDEIDRIFEKVREEYVSRQKGFGVDAVGAVPNRAPVNDRKTETAGTHPAPAPAAAARSSKPEEGSHGRKAVWIASGVAAATVGLAAVYFLASSGSAKEDKVYDVP